MNKAFLMISVALLGSSGVFAADLDSASSDNIKAVDIKVNKGQMFSVALVNNVVFTINPWGDK